MAKQVLYQEDKRTRKELIRALYEVSAERFELSRQNSWLEAQVARERDCVLGKEADIRRITETLNQVVNQKERARGAVQLFVEMTLAVMSPLQFWQAVRANARKLEIDPDITSEEVVLAYKAVAPGLGEKALEMILREELDAEMGENGD